ncbi:MAG TPA: PQQ-binding-like beta-propeller repeat protein [Anaerolineales bacterium]|nr:PQQ-binding-like beta-propeller repeat protein [Anaerolineales bacterium]
MARKYLTLILLGLALALGLTACGAPTASGWPGLAANDQLAFVVLNQQLHAINLADGKEAWAFPIQPDNSIGLLFAEPAVTPEVIVLGSEGPAGSHSGALFGLDPTTGQERWCLAFDDKGAKRQNCPPAPGPNSTGLFGIPAPTDNRLIGGVAITDGVAFFGLANGLVHAVKVADGAALWTTPFQADNAIWSMPHVDGEAVYVTSLSHSVYALDRATGRLKWEKRLGAAMAGGATAVDGKLYVGTFGSKLYALDAATGEEVWSMPTNNWVWSTPVVQAGVVYLTDLAGTMFAVEAETGVQKWAVSPGGRLRASPAVVGDTLYVGDEQGRLFALDAASGAQRWAQDVKGQLLTTPVVVNDLVLVAPYQGDNLLAAYHTAGGALRWAFAPSK